MKFNIVAIDEDIIKKSRSGAWYNLKQRLKRILYGDTIKLPEQKNDLWLRVMAGSGSFSPSCNKERR